MALLVVLNLLLHQHIGKGPIHLTYLKIHLTHTGFIISGAIKFSFTLLKYFVLYSVFSFQIHFLLDVLNWQLKLHEGWLMHTH